MNDDTKPMTEAVRNELLDIASRIDASTADVDNQFKRMAVVRAARDLRWACEYSQEN